VFATTAGGIIQYSFNGSQALPFNPPLPESGGLPTRLLAAVSSGPGKLDVFAVDPNIHMPLHWHFDGSWSKQIIGVPGLHSNSGMAAVANDQGHVELYAISADNKMWSCSGSAMSYGMAVVPAGPWPLPYGV